MKYKIFSVLFGWILPTKEDRKAFKIFCKDIDARQIHRVIKNKQYALLKKLRQEYKIRKLKVVFLNDDNTKWSYQSLYNAFNNNPNFDVQVLLTVPNNMLKHKNDETVERLLKTNYDFFKQNNINVDFAFDLKTKTHKSLKSFDADIVFYEQPWYLPKIYSVNAISDYALAFYSSYGSNISNGNNEYSQQLYKDVYTYFLDNSYAKDFLIAKGFDKDRLNVSGHLKLDAYLEPINENKIQWKMNENNTKHIIWAPHYSFFQGSDLQFGTFDWNCQFFLEYAKNHPEFEFIIKPHPLLKKEIVKRKLMKKSEMEEYFNTFTSLGNVQIYEKGDYFDMFRKSDLLITDCNSFLYEYLPTENPVIHLINRNSLGNNAFGRKITEGYYKVYNLDELEDTLDNLLIKNIDELKKTRKKIIKQELCQPQNGTANYIVNYITDILCENV